MGYKSPIQSPLSHDKFRLVEGKDTLYCPGTIPVDGAKLDPRAVEIQDMQQPGFAGSVALQKLEKIWTGTYRYKMWTQAEYVADKEFVKILRAGMKKGQSATGPFGSGRRARVWRISDPRLADLDITFVTVEHIGTLEPKGAGKWEREIKFHEWKKPIQLPLLKVDSTSADTDADRKNALLTAENKRLEARLAAMKNAKPKSLLELILP
jgi:hypothetical protein